MKEKLTPWFERITNSQTLMLGGMAVLVGLGTGAGVLLFKWLIEFLRDLMFIKLGAEFASLGGWTVALFPIAGGLIVGLLGHYFVGDEKLHGTAGIIQSVALAGGQLRYQNAPVKTAAAVISIGTGASVGSEDPSVQIGANFASMIGQIFHMSDERIRALVAAGAASAIAAAFNAPIAGAFFALEIVLDEIGSSTLAIILVATVTSSVFTQAVVGSSPAFKVPAFTFNSIWELPLYLFLGLLAGLVSALYGQLLYKMQDVYQAWNIPGWIKPASAGLAVGIVGIFLPQIFGVGYETIGEVLNRNQFGFWLVVALLVAKIILTPVSIGGGFWGGLFSPALFIGAMLGWAFGFLMATLAPSLGINPAAFALVGMAAVLAGAIRAPLASVILLFEMTKDYHIVLPLIFAVAASLLISQRFQKESVYTLGLTRRGIRLDGGLDVGVMGEISVGDAMYVGGETLYEMMSLSDAADVLAKARHHGLPAVNTEGWLIGILTVQDIEHANGETVGEACTREVEVAFADESLNMALQRMSQRDIGRLPVVARENPRMLLGILRRTDVIHAYQIALTRRVNQRHQEHVVRLGTLTPKGMGVSDVAVEIGASAADKPIKDILFPRECVIASVRRGGNVFIPHGETVLRAGDILVVVASDAAHEEVLRLCHQADGILPP